MKKLDTSAITSYRWMPLLANNLSGLAGIDFIQQAYVECLRALAGFLVADTTKVTIMYGCAITYPGSDVSVAEGWVFYLGELYYVPAYSATYHLGDYVNANIATNVYSNADPTTFSNGNAYNVHQQRQVTLSLSTLASSGNMPGYAAWLTVSTNSTATAATTTVLNTWLTSTYNVFIANYNKWVNTLSPAPIAVGNVNAPPFLNSWANDSGVSGVGTPSPLMFYKLQNRVYIWGEITHPGSVVNSNIFNLPLGYYPLAQEEIFTVPNTTTLTPSGAVANLYEHTIWITNGGAVTFLGDSTHEGSPFSISMSGINFLAAPLPTELELDE
jgi:hypothetical protein